MKKAIPVVALFLCLASALQAQEGKPLGHRVGLQLGSAAPTGEFDKSRFEQDYPPFARFGMTLAAHYARDLTPGIAVGATAGWRRNPFHMNKFVDRNDELVQSKEATAWQTGYVLADLYLQSRGESFFGYFKGSLGGALVKSPFVQVNTPYGSIVRTSDRASALAYGLAAGVGVEADRIGLSLELGSLLTSPTLTVQDVRGSTTTYKQAMNTIHLAFGVSYTL